LQLDRFNGQEALDSISDLQVRTTQLRDHHPIFATAADQRSNVAEFNDLYAKSQAVASDAAKVQAALAAANLNGQIAQLGKDWSALQDAYDKYAAAPVEEFKKLEADAALAASNLETLQQRLREQKNSSAWDDFSKVTSADLTDAEKKLAAANLAVNQAKGKQDADRASRLEALNKLFVSYRLGSVAHTVEDVLTGEAPDGVISSVDQLIRNTEALHTELSQLFVKVNDLHDHSEIVITSVVPPVTASSLITIPITVQDNYVPLTFAANPSGPSGSGSPVTKGAEPSASQKAPANAPTAGVQPAPPSNAANVTIQVEVHRIANFNVVGGMLISFIANRNYGVQTIGSGTAATTYAFQTQNDPVQLTALAGIVWYPGGRDMYPAGGRHPWNGGWTSVGTRQVSQRLKPGVLFGTSVASLGTSFIGLDFEPATGIDTFLGLTIGKRTSLSENIIPCPAITVGNCTGATPISGTVAPTRQGIALGFSVGFGFDANIFSLFGIKGGS
jgi:hypothetical protein